MTEPNIIKEVRKKYNLSYAELAEITGVKEGTLKNKGSTGDIGESIEKTLSLYIENKELKEELHGLEYLKTALSKFLGIKWL